MHNETKTDSIRTLVIGLGILLVFLLVSSSSMHYWDEYFYIYSVSMHEPSALLTMESGLAGIFPQGFFAAKVGFVYFLDWLVDLTGKSTDTLYTVQSAFSLITVLFVVASYGLLSQLVSRRDAFAITIILLFTPLVMYFNGKVLSEVPSFLLLVLAALCFLKSFNVTVPIKTGTSSSSWIWLILAMIFLFAAAWFRFISVIYFAGMVLGLFVMQDDRYPFWPVFFRAAITGIGAVILLVLFWLLVLDDPANSILGLLNNLVKRSQTLIIRIYAVAVFVQFFGLYLLFALWRPWTGLHRFALVWLLFTTVPFLIGSSYAEPRFFYMALTPFAILVWLGMQRLQELWPALLGGYKSWLLFALLVVLNRWILIPIMPIEHDQDAYRELMDRSLAETDAQYLVPWLSDYTLLRVMYPEANIFLTEDWAINGDDKFFSSAPFLEWVGTGYIANPEQLSRLPEPWRFAGWDYNPVILRMQSYAGLVGVSVGGISEGQKKHLDLSWLWRDPNYRKTKLYSIGNYEMYELKRAE